MGKFNIGDQVQSLDEPMEGIVSKIEGATIWVTTSDGFDMPFTEKEIIKISSKSLLEKAPVFVSEIQKKEERKKKTSPPSSKRKELYTVEVDLHIEKLVPSTRGMDNIDILNIQISTAQRSIEHAIKNRIPKLVLIHGVGEGVLKSELAYLYRKYPNVIVQEANYQKYGLGATELYFQQNPLK
jgi:dsDNA-specific endonuclease/ATPase MutS2